MLSNSLETGLNKSSCKSEKISDLEHSSVELVGKNKEFDLTNSEDLRLFLESADNIYKEILEFNENEKERESSILLNKKMAKLRELVFECDERSRQDIELITDDLVNEMQDLYNDVVNLHDAICEDYLLNSSFEEEVTKKNGMLKIKSEDVGTERNIGIIAKRLVEEKVEEQIGSEQADFLVEEIDSMIDVKKIKFAPSLYAQKQPEDIHPISKTEKKDPINAIYNEGLSGVMEVKEEYNKQLLSNKYLGVDKYTKFINEFYSSLEGFEKTLNLVVSEIESKTDSKLDSWLGVKFNSPFKFIQDMSVSEVQELASSGEARTVMEREGIKYESFLTWIDLIPDMQDVVGEEESLLFGELFAKWIIGSDIQERQEVA